LEQLFKLIFQNHPEFESEIKGISNERIAVLEKFSHLPHFPKDYITFLKYMGENLGRVKVIQEDESQWGPGDVRKYKYEILVDYSSILKEFKRTKENSKKGYEGLLSEHNLKPADYLMIGINTQSSDDGNFFLDLQSENLSVVEICFTLGKIERCPSFAEFLFKDYFRREVSTYLHNKKWME
jgi:SMI1/KNR4 family protein SUKH-1